MRTQALTSIAVGTVLVALASTGCTASAADPAVRVDGSTITVQIEGGEARIDVNDLRVDSDVELSAAAGTDLGVPGQVSVENDSARWSYPDRGLDVTAVAQAGRLVIDLTSSRDQLVSWPVTGAGARDLQLPQGEGLSIPVDDVFWNNPDIGLVGDEGQRLQDLTMPFWGFSAGAVGASYLVPTDLGTSLNFASVEGRLRSTATHEFSQEKGTGTYTVALSVTDGSPIAPALDYRSLLGEQGGLRTLQQKIAENPDTAKLIGAFHAYLWGDARTPEAIRQLHDLGITKMWLGYDSDDQPMTREAVETATNYGFLVGPYDTFANAQDPSGEVDNPSSSWPDGIWPDACVVGKSGDLEGGFSGRGCYLSSEALAADPELVASRVAAKLGNGVNSYFLDVDATGEVFDDYNPDHRMTQSKDRQNRIDRMKVIGKDLVLGSETAGSWANSVVSFSHGSSTPVMNGLWKAERDKANWGAYWGKNGPAFFFKSVALSAELKIGMFDPKYRVPLYETVLHDSVVSTDRWELSFNKLPAEQTDRTLLAMLYNTPLNYTLNAQIIAEEGPRMATMQKFFATLQEAAGTEPMTDFQWLSDDRMVQQTNFGEGKLLVTANFGDSTFHDPDVGDIGPGCVSASIDAASTTLCP
ncbi:glycoside hydrolase [Rhodococcus erythropolis]|uniref:glycoside hydrolase n=1 Tax=Rhodococcus erythropolis TaxID=1833 RepID=UPI0033A24091